MAGRAGLGLGRSLESFGVIAEELFGWAVQELFGGFSMERISEESSTRRAT